MLVNLNKIIEDGQSFELLEPGEYVATILKHDLEMSKSNKAMVKWNFQILEPKRRFFNYTLLDNEVGLTVFAQTVQNAGYTGNMEKFDIEKFCNSESVIGNKLVIVLGQEEYDGTMQNYVKYTKPIKE